MLTTRSQTHHDDTLVRALCDRCTVDSSGSDGEPCEAANCDLSEHIREVLPAHVIYGSRFEIETLDVG